MDWGRESLAGADSQVVAPLVHVFFYFFFISPWLSLLCLLKVFFSVSKSFDVYAWLPVSFLERSNTELAAREIEKCFSFNVQYSRSLCGDQALRDFQDC